MANSQAWRVFILQVLKILRIFYNKIQFYHNDDILLLLKINLKISPSRQQSFKKKFQHVQILRKKVIFSNHSQLWQQNCLKVIAIPQFKCSLSIKIGLFNYQYNWSVFGKNFPCTDTLASR